MDAERPVVKNKKPMMTCMLLSAVSRTLSRLRPATPRESRKAFRGSRKRIEFAKKNTPTTLQVSPTTTSSGFSMITTACRTCRGRPGLTGSGVRFGNGPDGARLACNGSHDGSRRHE